MLKRTQHLSLAVREMQVVTTLRVHFNLSDQLSRRKQITTDVSVGVRRGNPYLLVVGYKLGSHLRAS